MCILSLFDVFLISNQYEMDLIWMELRTTALNAEKTFHPFGHRNINFLNISSTRLHLSCFQLSTKRLWNSSLIKAVLVPGWKTCVTLWPIIFCASEPHPPRYQGRDNFWPHVANKENLIRCTFSGYIQKFGLKSQQLQEILGFQNFVKLRFLITLAYENSNNLLDLKYTELIFYVFFNWF